MLDALERRGFERPLWFTPAEFVRCLPPGELEPVARFTQLYNGVRFGGDTAHAAEMILLFGTYNLQVSHRELSFIERHGLLKKFVQEDAAGQR